MINEQQEVGCVGMQPEWTEVNSSERYRGRGVLHCSPEKKTNNGSLVLNNFVHILLSVRPPSSEVTPGEGGGAVYDGVFWTLMLQDLTNPLYFFW